MKKQIIFLTLLVMMLLAMVPVNAITITMANPGGIADRNILVYYSNGTTMAGLYNTSSIIPLDPSSDYLFTLVPIAANPLSDPVGFLNSGFAFVSTNAIPLFILVFLAGLYFRGH